MTGHAIPFVSALLIALSPSLESPAAQPETWGATTEPVRREGTRLVTPVNQIVTPAGKNIHLPGLRPQALALSPGGKLLVTAGKSHELVVLDPSTGSILERVALPSDAAREPAPGAVSTHILKPDNEGQLSFTGLVFSPDGTRVY